MRFPRPLCSGLLGAAVLAGCASPPRTDLAALPGKDACFWTSSLSDWTVVDDSTLLVTAPLPRDTYLVKLFAPIPDLRFHERLGFQSDDGDPARFCRQNGYVIAPGPVPQRWPVVAVQALTLAEAKQLLAHAGSPAPHSMDKPEQTPAKKEPRP
jgi:Family of unknown function (DUF6491)